MSSNIESLMQLQRNGVITDNDLRKGIRVLKIPDVPTSKPAESISKPDAPKESELKALENLRKKT